MSHNTVSVTVIALGHPHVMGRGSGIPSIETILQTTSHIPKEKTRNEIICDSTSLVSETDCHYCAASNCTTQLRFMCNSVMTFSLMKKLKKLV